MKKKDLYQNDGDKKVQYEEEEEKKLMIWNMPHIGNVMAEAYMAASRTRSLVFYWWCNCW